MTLMTARTVLPHIHTDVFRGGDVGHRRFHGVTGSPHVVEEKDWHRREAKDTQPGQSTDVRHTHIHTHTHTHTHQHTHTKTHTPRNTHPHKTTNPPPPHTHTHTNTQTNTSKKC